MKKIAVWIVCLLLLSACGRQPQRVIAGDADETEVLFLDPDQPISAQSTLEAEQIACTPLEKDGGVYGFELRFRQSADLDALLRSGENFYFGMLESGKKKLSVPMEDIRILTDIAAKSFVLTMLVPQDGTIHGGRWTVSFYISAREGSASDALFAAQKDVIIS